MQKCKKCKKCKKYKKCKNAKMQKCKNAKMQKKNIVFDRKIITIDMETTIISTAEVQNEYMDLVKTQVSEDMLDIKGFVTAINFNIDPLIIDEQWNMLNTRRPDELIVLTPQMLERLHFSRIPNLVKKLDQLFPASRGENNEYWGDGVNVSICLAVPAGTAKKGRGGAHSAARRENNEYWGDGVNVSINLLVPSGTSKTKHGGTRSFKQIKMTKGAYKQLLMETQTDAARQVRKYYICLEELFVQYLLYQRAFELVKADRNLKVMATENKVLSDKLDCVIAQNKEVIAQNEGLARQNEGLARQNDGLARQNEGLARQNDGLSKQLEIQDKKLDVLSQILYKETDNKVVDVLSSQKQQELVVLQNKDDPETCVVLRGQKAHISSRVKRSQDQMHVVGTVESYKNPINLYNRFSEQAKKNKDSRFDVSHNKVTLKNGTTPTELLGVFNTLNEQKHDVAEQVQSAL